MTSGKTISSLRAESKNPLPCEFIKLGLYRDREELYPMIEARVEAMMVRGLLEEVLGLMDKGMSRTARQAIGYKELIAHFVGEYSLEEAVGLIKRNTRRLAKRQYTWFRQEEGLAWVDVTGCATADEAYEKVRKVLGDAGVL